MKKPIILRVYLKGELKSAKQFSEAQIVIGRNSDATLLLDHSSVSPIHTVIEERDSGYYVADMGSAIGTLKNGKKIFDEPMNPGDDLQIGDYKIEFLFGDVKPTQPPKGFTSPMAEKLILPDAPVEEPPQASAKSASKSHANAPKTIKSTSSDTTRSNAPSSNTTSVKPVVTKTTGESSKKLSQILKVSKGSTLEVVVAWNERVISTHHFNKKGNVHIGSEENSEIVLPLLGIPKIKHLLMTLDTGVKIFITPEMTGDYFKESEEQSLADLKRKNRLKPTADGFEFDLAQGEMIRLGLHGDLVSIYIRFIPDSASPIIGPLLDLTASESTAVMMSFVIATLLGLYMLIYSPKPIEADVVVEEPIRKATIVFAPPKPKIIEVTDATPKEKKIVKVNMNSERTTTKNDPGKAAGLRPSDQNKKTDIVSSSIKQGGTIKTGKEAANAKSETRDVSKLGLLSTFGGKGTQSQLSKAYSGSGELLGDAAKATGSSGFNDDRAAETLGGRLKNVGAGGKGTATYGIANLGTQGKGTGTFGTGDGGLGKRGKVDINIGESEAEFSGSIDREAIRRVIRENLKQFEYCYNQALRKNSEAYGKVQIKWHIEEHGRATHAEVKSNTIGDKGMGQCLARVISGLTFPEPPPDQIAEVVYPFVFRSQ